MLMTVPLAPTAPNFTKRQRAIGCNLAGKRLTKPSKMLRKLAIKALPKIHALCSIQRQAK